MGKKKNIPTPVMGLDRVRWIIDARLNLYFECYWSETYGGLVVRGSEPFMVFPDTSNQMTVTIRPEYTGGLSSDVAAAAPKDRRG